MRSEVLSSVGAQGVDTSGYQVSDLDVVNFYRENYWLHLHAIFRPGIDTTFSPSTFKGFEKGSRAKNPIPIDEEQDKENSPPPHPTYPVSEKLHQHHVLIKSPPLGTRIEKFPEDVNKKLFQKFILFLLCMFFKMKYIWRVSIYHKLFEKVVRNVWDKCSTSIVSKIIVGSSNFLHTSSPYR